MKNSKGLLRIAPQALIVVNLDCLCAIHMDIDFISTNPEDLRQFDFLLHLYLVFDPQTVYRVVYRIDGAVHTMQDVNKRAKQLIENFETDKNMIRDFFARHNPDQEYGIQIISMADMIDEISADKSWKPTE